MISLVAQRKKKKKKRKIRVQNTYVEENNIEML